MQLDSIKATDVYDKLVILGDDWAEKRAALGLLENTKKSLVAKLMGGVEGSQAAREAYALRHADYEAHIKKIAEAEEAEIKARVRYDSAQTWVELKRTEAANERAALRVAS